MLIWDQGTGSIWCDLRHFLFAFPSATRGTCCHYEGSPTPEKRHLENQGMNSGEVEKRPSQRNEEGKRQIGCAPDQHYPRAYPRPITGEQGHEAGSSGEFLKEYIRHMTRFEPINLN
jgi:hypothetical protein